MIVKTNHEFIVPCLGVMIFKDQHGKVTDIALIFKFFQRTLHSFAKDVRSEERGRLRCLMMVRIVEHSHPILVFLTSSSLCSCGTLYLRCLIVSRDHVFRVCDT